jgi:hypothetical protein
VPTFSLDFAKLVGEELGIDWNTSPFAPEELQRGMEVELEHGTALDPRVNITNDDPIMTAQIAWAHLLESPLYYQALAKMEQALEKKVMGKYHFRVAQKDELANWLRSTMEMKVEQQLDLEVIWKKAWQESFGDEETDALLLREIGLTPDVFMQEVGKQIKKVSDSLSDNDVAFWRKEVQKVIAYLWVELVGLDIPLPGMLIKPLADLMLEYELTQDEEAGREAEDIFQKFLDKIELNSDTAINMQAAEQLWYDLTKRVNEETDQLAGEIEDITGEATAEIENYLNEFFYEKSEEYRELLEDGQALEDLPVEELQEALEEERQWGPR